MEKYGAVLICVGNGKDPIIDIVEYVYRGVSMSIASCIYFRLLVSSYNLVFPNRAFTHTIQHRAFIFNHGFFGFDSKFAEACGASAQSARKLSRNFEALSPFRVAMETVSTFDMEKHHCATPPSIPS